MLNKVSKQKLIAKFRTHENDTGSPQVQIAILTEEIKELTKHLKLHKKDFSSRRGLVKKLNQRRKLLRFLEQDNNISFEKLIKKLNIKIAKTVDMALESQTKVRRDVQKEIEKDGKKTAKEIVKKKKK